jgi:hypothetical protein
MNNGKKGSIKTYGKLANLNIVYSEYLLFWGGSKSQSWNISSNEIKCSQNDACSDKRICAATDRIGKLVP